MLLPVRRTISGLLFLLTFAMAATSVVAEEALLHGPHPFLKENELTIHTGYSLGFADAPRGLRVQADDSYRMRDALWLDLAIGMVSGSCRNDIRPCNTGSGNAIEVLAGAVWKYQMDLPIVPYAKLQAGPIFLFPDGNKSASGLLLRGGVGAHYYLFDWFGLGAEITGAWGRTLSATGPSQTGNLGSLDMTLGAAWQF
jgi:hypothetical protein